MSKAQRRYVRPSRSGVCYGFEQVTRVVLWMQARKTSPTWREVSEQWGVNRATAYRWLAAWRAAKGEP